MQISLRGVKMNFNLWLLHLLVLEVAKSNVRRARMSIYILVMTEKVNLNSEMQFFPSFFEYFISLESKRIN